MLCTEETDNVLEIMEFLKLYLRAACLLSLFPVWVVFIIRENFIYPEENCCLIIVLVEIVLKFSSRFQSCFSEPRHSVWCVSGSSASIQSTSTVRRRWPKDEGSPQRRWCFLLSTCLHDVSAQHQFVAFFCTSCWLLAGTVWCVQRQKVKALECKL